VVEATVVAAGEGHHELARLLRDLSAEQAVLLESGWRDEVGFVAQKLFAFRVGIAEVTLETQEMRLIPGGQTGVP
jgi:hypothetical protein